MARKPTTHTPPSEKGDAPDKGVSIVPPATGDDGATVAIKDRDDLATRLKDAQEKLAIAQTDLEIRAGENASLKHQLAEAERLLAAFRAKEAGSPDAPASGGFVKKVAPEGKVLAAVTGPKQGRFRIGRRFGAEQQTIAVTPDELARLQADPALTVRTE